MQSKLRNRGEDGRKTKTKTKKPTLKSKGEMSDEECKEMTRTL